MSVLNLAAATADTAIPESTGFTVAVGVIGVLLSLPCWFIFIKGFTHMVKTIMVGQKTYGHTGEWGTRIWTMIREIVSHTKMAKKPGVAVAHWFVMVGFLLGSLVWFEAYIQTFWPAGGWPILRNLTAWHFIDELLGLGTTLGILALIIVRQTNLGKERLSRFYGSNAGAAYFVEAVVLIEGLGMMFVKAAKLATYGDSHHAEVWNWANFVTGGIAQILPASEVMVSIFALIKLLSGMVWLFVVGRNLTWGVAWHRFLAFANILLKRNADGYNALASAKPMTSNGEILNLEEADPEVDSMGTGVVTDHSWKALLDFTSCTECGRCQEQCPAWNTSKPLSPKLLVNQLRDHAYASAPYLLAGETIETAREGEGAGAALLTKPLVGDGDEGVIDQDVLWSCTNCGACVEQCPVDIEHIDHIVDMRRYQVLVESDFPTELAGLFKNLETKGNPWGQNASTRADWINEVRKEGIVVPIWGEDVESFDDTEYLFWVGCAGAYDDNAKKTTKAVAEMLYTAGVKYAVLSQAEGCTGDSARRAGNEFLFQMLAEQNIEQLDEVFDGVPPKQRKIVVTCAHCFNTFKNEYPELGGQYEVVHHTQLLNKLVRANRLQPVASGQGRQVTYHDPCFLGRHNKVFEAPRELIGASGANLVEMPRNKNTGFCCGAGGARMWMEETIGQRINVNRTEEAVGTGAEAIAIGCPFCKTMMNDGVNNVIEDDEKKPEVLDIAQMLRDSVKVDGELPQAREPEWIEQPERGWVDPKKAEEEERQRLEEEEAKRKKAEAAEKKKAEKTAAAGAGAAAAGAAAGAAAKGGAPTPGGAKKGAPAPGGAPTPGGAKKGAPAPGGAPKPGGAKAGAPTPGGAKKGAPAPGGAPKPGGAKAGAPTPGGAKKGAPAPGGAPKPGGAKAGAPTPGGAKKGAPAPGGAPKPGGAKGGAPVPGGAKKGAPVPGGAKAAKPAAQAEPAAAETEAPAEAPKATKGAPIPGGARKGAPVPGGAKKAAPATKPKAEEAAPAEDTAAQVAATKSEQPAAEQPKTASGAPVPGGARKGAPIPGGARKAKPVASAPAPAVEETEAQEASAQPEAEQAPEQPEVTEQQSAEGATSTEQAAEAPAEETQAPSASAKNLPRNQHGVPLPGSARRK
ncbi:heterodisulfide reductase-related iron-sulfur binding cluster [Corynebacterium sp. LK24]|uniref:heterodisulfide reductase-related iron-sulfur binding cluster n=1 Tax=Corynebacterium sp. LK24 TaxID=2044583 RepID=UPI001652AA04|nr:heterodisulfide reductase-related iron-sulfur binding cluster [Corynebacterium sp. LK24]MBC6759260.1 Fe-S oxidoreductase [Corynebacterium sp. LK24]